MPTITYVVLRNSTCGNLTVYRVKTAVCHFCQTRDLVITPTADLN